MKKIFGLIVLLAGVISFTSCSREESVFQELYGASAHKLEITSSDVFFEHDGGAGSIVVNTTEDLTATTDAQWLTLSVVGNKVTVEAEPNTKLDGRSGTVQLKTKSASTKISVTQKGILYGIESLELEMADYQASLNIDVVHTQKVEVESQTEWLTAVFNEETNQIELVAQDNDEADPREGIVKVTMGDYTDELVVTQKGILFELEKETLATKNDEKETFEITVNHSRAVTVESNDDWITVKWNAQKNLLTCVVAANTTGWKRTGTVTLSSGPSTKTITISQADFAKDILGDFYLWFSQSATEAKWAYLPVTLTATSIDFTLEGTEFSIPISFPNGTEEPYLIQVEDEPYIGKYSDYPCYLAFDAYNYNLFNRYPQYFFQYCGTSTCTAELEEDENTDGSIYFGGGFEGVMELDGSPLDNGNINTWILVAMKEEPYSQTNLLGALMNMYYPQLEKVFESATTAPKRSPRRIHK